MTYEYLSLINANAMEKKKYPNYCSERQLQTYPHPKYHKLFIADCRGTLAGKSEHLERIMRTYYDSMSPQQIKALNDLYDEMTEEQRKNPKRV